MKIVTILSSGRKNGNTEQTVSLVEAELHRIAEAQQEKMEIDRIDLGHAGLKLCIGCRACFDRGEQACPLKDDLLAFRDKLAAADGMILASPVYVEDVNGILKNWIDRMAFNCHRPAYSGKTAVVAATSGVGSSTHALKTMKTALSTWGFCIAGQQKFRTGALMSREEILSRHESKIKKLAHGLFQATKGKKALKPSLYSLIVFKVQQKYWQNNTLYRDTMDYAHWDGKGWLKPGCTYYDGIRSNRLKVAFARLVGAMIAVFFV